MEKLIPEEFSDLVGVQEVAEELGITDKKARVLMSEQVITSVRINGIYTKRAILNKYKSQRQMVRV